MKKILSLALTLALVFSFAACSKKDTSSDVSAPAHSGETDDYVAVLSVKINPEFEVYLTKTLTVLRAIAVNDDAKSFESDLDSKEDDLKKVIKDIIAKANEKGFIKKDATVTFSVTENKSESLKNDDIISRANTAVTEAATALGIDIKSGIATDAEQSSSDDNNSTASQNNNNSKSTDSNSQPTASSEPTVSSQPSHTHSYSAATCTEPRKCSCGEVGGPALGHDYKNGKCSRCGASNLLNPKEKIKMQEEYVAKKYFVYDAENIYAPGLQFYNDGGYGDGEYYCIMLQAMFTSNLSDAGDYVKDRTPVEYNGTKYYRCGAGQSPALVELTDDTIIITTSEGQTIKAVLMNDGNIKITESNDTEFAKDTVLSIAWNMLS